METAFRGTPVVESEPRGLWPSARIEVRDKSQFKKFMKPTPSISSQPTDRQNFPLTDYQYQSTLETPRAAVKQTRAAHDLRGFWKLSTGFFGAEAKLNYATEFMLFSLITALSTWPVISMLVAVTRMVRNY